MSSSPEPDQRQANRLARETSPYLLQHSRNPVDWYPWGEEAFQAAREMDRAIFLSIGYSTCHWCHVMERESFENPEIAAILNESFISIKVDREERPDVDEVYMQAAQLLTGGGGWPLSVFLTPQLEPFYAGTYFPPEDAFGRPGFARVLRALSQAYRERRDEVQASASDLVGAIRQNVESVSRAGEMNSELVESAVESLISVYDAQHGGFGQPPKFPPSFSLALLLRSGVGKRDDGNVEVVLETLDNMARGGILDQVGGGFHRYSTDAEWLVPHFEKMLYDNALMALALLDAWQVSHDDGLAIAASRTLDFVLREMTHAQGGFYSALDADSEGEEGRFYVWRPEEVKAALGEDDASLFCRIYNITPGGNFEHGTSIPNIPIPLKDWAVLNGHDEPELRDRLGRILQSLLAARDQRVRPHLDDKVITAWNGLMIAAMARAGWVLDREDYTQAARSAADFVLNEVTVDGRLAHTWRDGVAKGEPFQEDYACLLLGLLELYRADFDVRWIRYAKNLAEEMISDFWDAASGGFYFSRVSHQTPLVRSKNPTDGVTPGGNSAAAHALARLGRLLDRDDFATIARTTVTAFAETASRAPRAFENLIAAADFLLQPPREIVLAGEQGSEEIGAMLDVLRKRFLPYHVVAYTSEDSENLAAARGKGSQGRSAAAYVCQNHACQAPVFSAKDLSALLDA